jgi:hypothetical protein
MATRAYSILRQESGYIIVRWAGLLNADDGEWFPGALEYGDRCIQVAGTFGTATLAVQGTNFLPPENGTSIPTNGLVLTDPQGGNLTGINSARIETIMEVPAAVRPVLTGGDGTTNLTVIFTGRRTIR